MAKSECFCRKFSCESVVEKVGDEIVHPNKRFRFEKTGGVDGVIFDGKLVDNRIALCEIKGRKIK